MSVAGAEMIWRLVGAYAVVGFLVALAMILGLIKRVDPLAHAAPWRVKLLLFPGLAALWPLVTMLAVKRGPGAEP